MYDPSDSKHISLKSDDQFLLAKRIMYPNAQDTNSSEAQDMKQF